MSTAIPGIDAPGKIIAVHLNYPSRAAQRGRTPSQPSYFLKPASSLAPSGSTLERPAGTELLAFEGEIALIIGEPARRVSPDAGWGHVAAVTAANDFGLYDLRAADKGSNEARLIIVNHLAGSDWGDYKASDIMDGVAAGGGYVASARTLELAAPNDTVNYKFTFTKRSDGTGAVLNLLRGRTIVYVNGKRAVTEVANGSSVLATVPVSGTVRLSGTDYTLTGWVRTSSTCRWQARP